MDLKYQKIQHEKSKLKEVNNMNYTCILLGVIFMIFGAAFACGKCHIHLSAWKNISQEEKEKINILPLIKNIGAFIFTAGFIFLINGIWKNLSNHTFIIMMIIWFLLAGCDVYYISKSTRYNKE